MMASLALMIPAAVPFVMAQVSASFQVMLETTVVVVVSTGLDYRGSLQVVNQITPPDKRTTHDAGIVNTHIREKLVEFHVLLRERVNEIVILKFGNGEHGAPSSFASYEPFNRWMPPGPDVARQMPSRPMNLA
jgi:hypothetical protein